MMVFGKTGKKLKYFFSEPVKASGVVGKTVASVVSGRQVDRHAITAEDYAKAKFTLGDAVALPVATVAGSGLGLVGGTLGSQLSGKAGDFVAANPLAAGGLVAAAVAAPVATVALTNVALNQLSSSVPNKPETLKSPVDMSTFSGQPVLLHGNPSSGDAARAAPQRRRVRAKHERGRDRRDPRRARATPKRRNARPVRRSGKRVVRRSASRKPRASSRTASQRRR